MIAAQPEYGDLALIFADVLNPANERVEIVDSYMAYASGCEARGLQAMPMEQYPAALTKLCRKLRIQVESEEEGVFLKGVALRA